MAHAVQDMMVGGEQTGFATVQAAWPQPVPPLATAVMAWQMGSANAARVETARMATGGAGQRRSHGFDFR